MAFEKEATLKGSKYIYSLNPLVKKFTLRDNGFVQTMNGNHQFVRTLEATPQSKEGFRLKITVNKDLQTFKMGVTTKDGLRTVDLFKKEEFRMMQEKFYFLMEGMIDRGVFEKK
ncbi:MAG: DUF1831 domain-containing protein [Streptococcaceae bacterium]|jgi:hypothetical protein|nr:DUF1831 domain-containing protein [Streptococcaceae bacterium]